MPRIIVIMQSALATALILARFKSTVVCFEHRILGGLDHSYILASVHLLVVLKVRYIFVD